MLKKIKLDKKLNKIKSAAKTPGRAFRNILNSMNPDAKSEILDWLDSVQSVKKAKGISKKEKEQKLHQLRPSGTVISFFDSVMDVLISKIPIQNKSLLRAGITGISVAASFMNFRKAGIALVVLQQALPKYMMSNHFDDVSAYLVTELQKS
jgi:hypothetical protein